MAGNNELSQGTVNSYAEGIGMKADVDIKRTQEVFNLGKSLCPEGLKTIFISNYLESDGKEQLKDLWLFSDNYVIEALNFMRIAVPKLEMTILSKNISCISLEAQHFDFSKEVTGESKLHIVVLTFIHFTCDFTAVGQNCDALNLIYKSHLKENLVRGQSSALL
ncbi:MAG: hypothetical protein WC749_10490 [Dehalococcoidia bacterium]